MSKFLQLSFLFCIFSFCVYSQEQKKESQYEPLRITYKSPVSYTTKARKAGIEGIVRLRITFQADSKIGEIVDITEKNKDELSEYGLTEKAINSAKGIRFIPAKVDGEFVTVKKVVEYKFTLY